MRFSTRFMRHCPTCGRNLDIGVEQIGRMVMCSHCHAEFQATLVASLGDNDIEQSLDQRIERLLSSTSSVPSNPHFDHHSSVHTRSYEV